jgi:hypothetical protein
VTGSGDKKSTLYEVLFWVMVDRVMWRVRSKMAADRFPSNDGLAVMTAVFLTVSCLLPKDSRAVDAIALVCPDYQRVDPNDQLLSWWLNKILPLLPQYSAKFCQLFVSIVALSAGQLSFCTQKCKSLPSLWPGIRLWAHSCQPRCVGLWQNILSLHCRLQPPRLWHHWIDKWVPYSAGIVSTVERSLLLVGKLSDINLGPLGYHTMSI